MPTTITDNARLQRLRDFGMSIKESQPAHSQLKRASVLVLITQDWHILLTRRSKQLKSHPGEVCLPGGKQDPEDHQDDLVTALRETKEEVGLHLLDVMTPLCRLPTLESINHLCVTPIVVYVETPHSELALQLNINPTEVDVAFWVPLKYFSKVAPVEQYEIPWSGETFVFRRYHYCQDENGNNNNSQQYSITGLTAHIAHHVSTVANNNALETTVTSAKENHEGYLWRLQEEGSGKPYWSRRYYVLSRGKHKYFHQYDNAGQADRKSLSANKKHRLSMEADIQVENYDYCNHGNNDTDDKHAFQILALEGRIVWKLAAKTLEEKEEWKQRILQATSSA